ncbi:hypothetical protein [Methylohalobius crimeensis]|uniref:hypothetical protein n=1 Tax=Methylohalobius crimeensis TaxID=244365 RepID=UPI0003B64184|nr:hypothetical protein [Methylohalobius crimeensis]
MEQYWRKKLLTIGLSASLVAGCASQGQKADTAQPASSGSSSIQQSSGPIAAEKIPTNSPFAKVEKEMSEGRVYDLIGQPTEVKTYMTGKSWIPFYYGPDTHRKEALYKGQGRIVFTASGMWGTGVYKVYQVIYDPTEDGYAD